MIVRPFKQNFIIEVSQEETVEERGIPTSISRDTDTNDTGTSSTPTAYLSEPRGSAPNVAYTSETSPVAKS